MNLTNNMKVIDLETMGFSPAIYDKITKELKYENDILEIGVTELSIDKDKKFKIGKNYSRLIKPTRSIPSNITNLTNITNDMVKNQKTIEEVLPNFRKYIGNDLVIGHNLSYDLKFLNYYLEKYNLPLITNQICTLEMLKKVQNYTGENKKLGTACEYYGIKLNKAHRAYADTYATAQLFIKLIDELDFFNNFLMFM